MALTIKKQRIIYAFNFECVVNWKWYKPHLRTMTLWNTIEEFAQSIQKRNKKEGYSSLYLPRNWSTYPRDTDLPDIVDQLNKEFTYEIE